MGCLVVTNIYVQLDLDTLVFMTSVFLRRPMHFEIVAKCHTTKARVSRMTLARAYSVI